MGPCGIPHVGPYELTHMGPNGSAPHGPHIKISRADQMGHPILVPCVSHVLFRIQPYDRRQGNYEARIFGLKANT